MIDTASPTTSDSMAHDHQAIAHLPAGIRPLVAMLAETWKGMQIMWSFKFNLLSDVLSLFLIFLGINFFMGYGSFQPDSIAFTLVGFCLWTYAAFAIGNMSFALREEQQQGTVEQMCMGATPFSALLFGRTLSNFIWTTAIVLVGGGSIALGFQLELGLTPSVIPVLILALVGLYGLGFLIGGLTLLFKNILSLSNMMQNLLLFLNGAIVPVTAFPNWMTQVTRVLPTTLSIEVVRMITLDGQSLLDAWNAGLLPLLALHSTTWFVVGLALFAVADRAARKRGLMGQF